VLEKDYFQYLPPNLLFHPPLGLISPDNHLGKTTEMTLYFYNAPSHMDNDCYPSNLYHLSLVFWLKPRIQNSKILHNQVHCGHFSTRNHNDLGTIPSPYT